MFHKLLNFIKTKSSVIFLLIIIGFIGLKNYNERLWSETRIIDSDIISYYAYLPAFLIKKDIKLKFTENTDYYQKAHQYWPLKAPNGGNVIKTTMGLAVLYSPFFVIAHFEAYFKNYKLDGFSYPYQKWIHLSGFFYLILGLIFLRKFLNFFFNDFAVGITLFILVLCTNTIYYCSVLSAMPHIFDFFFTFNLFVLHY